MSANDSFQFEHLSRLLAPIDPAELHGLLCGLLCARINPDRNQWLLHAREMLADDSEFSSTVNDLLWQWFDEGIIRINSLDEPITPLLPDDDAPLSQRVNALSGWCQGLLYGLGLGEIGPDNRLSAESQEFLRDIADIAQVGFDTDEGGEADENAYFEVIEYLRVGTLLIHQDTQRSAASSYPP
ncbi:MAG: UPF0149 family protein [Gammaproteobacteria bacterium]|nr:UPF0149 family protein [Gammaproteobacteria bacterium]